MRSYGLLFLAGLALLGTAGAAPAAWTGSDDPASAPGHYPLGMPSVAVSDALAVYEDESCLTDMVDVPSRVTELVFVDGIVDVNGGFITTVAERKPRSAAPPDKAAHLGADFDSSIYRSGLSSGDQTPWGALVVK